MNSCSSGWDVFQPWTHSTSACLTRSVRLCLVESQLGHSVISSNISDVFVALTSRAWAETWIGPWTPAVSVLDVHPLRSRCMELQSREMNDISPTSYIFSWVMLVKRRTLLSNSTELCKRWMNKPIYYGLYCSVVIGWKLYFIKLFDSL